MLVVDITHWIDRNGEIPYGNPDFYALANYCASIIELGSPHPIGRDIKTPLSCTGPDSKCGHKGKVVIRKKSESDHLSLWWRCTKCHNAGVIRNWQGTQWDWSGLLRDQSKYNSGPPDSMTRKPAARTKSDVDKVVWSGHLTAIQPRIRLTRSYDQRSHSYQGYVLRIEGRCGNETGEFLIAIGEKAHEKHQFQAGMELNGQSVLVDDPRMETARFYKTSGLKMVKDAEGEPLVGPPFLGIPPDLEIYRSRGHRRLDVRTYEAKCTTCIWGCRMPVEMIIDQWNPSKKKYRFETFCYGPKSCPSYKAGPKRKVPGRKGMSYTEEDWVDEDATSHRGTND